VRSTSTKTAAAPHTQRKKKAAVAKSNAVARA
jgi:hypothetical protein